MIQVSYFATSNRASLCKNGAVINEHCKTNTKIGTTAAGAIAAKTPVGRAFLAGWTIGKLINSIPGFSDGVQSLLDKLLGTQDDDYAQVRGMIEVLDNYITQIDNPALSLKDRETKLAGFNSHMLYQLSY